MTDDGSRIRFTEKSLKPMIAGHTALIAGNTGTAQLMRNHGFRLYRPPHDYDFVETAEGRLECILQEFERLMRLSDTDYALFLAEQWDDNEHNIRQFGAIGGETVQDWMRDLSFQLSAG